LATASQLEPIQTARTSYLYASQVQAASITGTSSRAASLWALLMSVTVLGTLLRIAAVFEYNPLEVLNTDPGRWWFTATHFSSLQPITAIDPFGYPLWLGGFIALAGTGAIAIAIHNAALSVLTPWIWHRFVRELTGDRDLALAGWAIFVWLPSWIAVYSYTLSETLFLPLFGVALWCSVKAYKTGYMTHYAMAALIWALSSATRVFALPCALIVLIWISWGREQQARKLVSAIVIFAAIATPLSIRAHHILRIWRPFGFPRMNQIYMVSGKKTLRFEVSRDRGGFRWRYEFGSPSLYQAPFEPLSSWMSAREGIVCFSIDADKGMVDWDQVLQKYNPSLKERLQQWRENYIMFNFAPSWPDDNPDRFWDNSSKWMRWCWLPLAACVIAGNVRFRRHLGTATAAMFAALTTIAWTFTPLLPAVMEGRYRKPIEGLLIVNLLLLVHLNKLRKCPNYDWSWDTRLA